MGYSGGPVDPNEYYRSGFRIPYTGGSVVYPTTDSNIITNFINYKQALAPDDEENNAKIDKLTIEYLEWKKEEYKKVYKNQVQNGKCIFYMVIVIVSLGLLFTGIQFFLAMKYGLSTNFSVNVSATTLQLTTSLVGGLILLLSLGFFYLFLRYAYIINPPSDFIHTTIGKMKKK